jgi:Pathogenicity locus
MKGKANIKLELSDNERTNLRKNKIKKSEILEYASDELAGLLNVSELRAKEIYALADFQQIPSIGIEFAKDLIFLGYYRVEELNGKNGAELTDNYEKKKGFKTDPCVEDQFRLAVNFAKHKDYSKNWWDFTNERKEYRTKIGYPNDRPKINRTER